MVPILVGSVVAAGGLRRTGQPSLAVDELILRPFRAADAPALAAAYRDPEIRRWHVRSMDEDEARAWIATSAARWEAETAANWAVADASGSLLGRVGFRAIDLAEGVAEIAYWTLPPARGRRIARRSVRAVSTWAFTEVGLHRIELNHSTVNEASCRVAVAAGYAYEGTRREQVRHADGWHDMHVHGRLAGDDASTP